eukprot:m.223286 g.223286  ORF g.223286 m.223286 type:complete len:355 (-) comp16221_c0_seq1:23-1087(-)
MAQRRRVNVVDRVHRAAPARKRKALHVAALGAAQGHDAFLGQRVERQRVDALLVEDHKRLAAALGADLLLESDDLSNAIVDKLALGNHHGLTLRRRLVEEAGIHLRLLVFERHVAGEDKAVLQPLGHVRVSSAVVQHQTLDQLCVHVGLVLHLHHLDHEEVNGLGRPVNGQHRIHHCRRQHISKSSMDLGAQGGAGNREKGVAVDGTSLELELVQHPERLLLGNVKAVHQRPRVQALGDVELGLLEQLADEQHVRGRAIARHVILRSGSTSNQRGSGVLDLHLLEQDHAVLGDLDVTSATHKHLHGATGTKICAKHLLQTTGSRDVEVERLSSTSHLGFGIESCDGRHDTRAET